MDINLKEMFDNDPELLAELEPVKHFLVDTCHHWKHHSVYNFAFHSLSNADFRDNLQKVYNELTSAAKINVSFGFVLKSVENEYRYYYAHNNNTLFDLPVVLADKDDLRFILDNLDDESYFEHMMRERENTKWRFYCVTNMTIFAYLMPRIPLGCKTETIPLYLSRNKQIFTLLFNHQRNKIGDNFCLFRAICFHKFDLQQSNEMESAVEKLANEYFVHCEKDRKRFRGVKDDEIHVVETLAGVNVVVYSCEQDESGKLIGMLSRRSLNRFSDTVYLLRYGKHVCYIRSPSAVFRKYRCPNCDTHFDKTFNFERHLRTCDERVKHVYPGGVYELKRTIFDELDEIGIQVPPKDRLFQNLAIFDFESICQPNTNDNVLKNTTTTTWVGKHVPISVSISSNMIDGTIFVCNNNPMILVEQFCAELKKLQEKSAKRVEKQFDAVFKELDDLIFAVKRETRSRDIDKISETADSSDELPDLPGSPTNSEYASDLKIESDTILKKLLTMYEGIRKKLEKYCSTLPCFGFNSSRYDINLIKEYLLALLVKQKLTPPEVIKKTNQYVSFYFDKIQFLDILNFLGGATSLDSFLKAYQTTETKGFFPYEWFDCAEKLNETCLPPIGCFWSQLKNCNVLSADRDKYTKLLENGMSQALAWEKRWEYLQRHPQQKTTMLSCRLCGKRIGCQHFWTFLNGTMIRT